MKTTEYNRSPIVSFQIKEDGNTNITPGNSESPSPPTQQKEQEIDSTDSEAISSDLSYRVS